MSHSRAIRSLQRGSCTTMEKTAIVAGSKQKWESSNIPPRAKTTAMVRCELAQVVCFFFFFFSGRALPLSYVRIALSGCAFCGISSTIKRWIDHRRSFCCVGNESLKHLQKCFSEDCFVA